MSTPGEFLTSDADISLGDLIVLRNGSKSAALTCGGQPLRLKLGSAESPLYAPFGFSSFDGQTHDRESLDVQSQNEECISAIESLDAKVLKKLKANLSNYTNATKAQVDDWWRPTVKHSEKYPPIIRTKCTKSKVRVRGPDKAQLSVEDVHPRSEMAVVVTARNVYFQSKGMGVCLEVSDILLLSNDSQNCPWE